MEYLHHSMQYKAVQSGKHYNLYSIKDSWQDAMCQLPAELIEGGEDWLPQHKTLDNDFFKLLNTQ